MTDVFEQEEQSTEKKLTVPEALELLLHGFQNVGHSLQQQALSLTQNIEEVARIKESVENLTKALGILGDHLHELSMETSERYRAQQAEQESLKESGDGEVN